MLLQVLTVWLPGGWYRYLKLFVVCTMFLIKTKNGHTFVVLDYVTKQINSVCNLPENKNYF